MEKSDTPSADDGRDPRWLQNQIAADVAAGKLTQAEADANRADRSLRRWNADQPTAETQAMYDAAKLLGQTLTREPASLHINIASRLIRAIGLLVRRIEDDRRALRDLAQGDHRAAAIERRRDDNLKQLRQWLTSSPKGATSPHRYLEEHPSTTAEGWDQLAEMPLPPIDGIDRPTAARALASVAQELIDEHTLPKRVGEHMAMAVAIHFPALCPPGELLKGVTTLAAKIAEYAAGKKGLAWSTTAGENAVRLAVTALEVFGMHNASDLYKAKASEL